MAYIKIINRDYKIFDEFEIPQPEDNEFNDKILEYAKRYPGADCVAYFSDKDIEMGYNHPCMIPTDEYVEYLRSIGRW